MSLPTHKTKIVATIGPASDFPEMLERSRALPSLLLPWLGVLVCLIFTGCRGIGPGTVARDLKTKRTFAFMMMLFTLAETGDSESLPLITIPAQ